MAQQIYDETRVRDTDRHLDHREKPSLMRMLLPFIVGLVVGWGANELADRDGDTARINNPELRQQVD